MGVIQIRYFRIAGIVDSEKLSAAEADLSFTRALQLVESPVVVAND